MSFWEFQNSEWGSNALSPWEYSNESLSSSSLISPAQSRLGVSKGIRSAKWIDQNGVETFIVKFKGQIFIQGTTAGFQDYEILEIGIHETVSTHNENLNVEIKRFQVSVVNNEFSLLVDLNSRWYLNTAFIKSLFFKVHFQGDNSNQEYRSKRKVRVEIIEEIRNIMRANDLNVGAQCQDIWLSNSAENDPDQSPPVFGVISMNWILGFSRAKELYDEIFEDGIFSSPVWRKENALTALKGEIKRMVEDGFTTIPQNAGDITSYGGITDTTTIPGTNRPRFDQYFHTFRSSSFTLNNIFGSIDDFLATIGALQFRILGKGQLKRVDQEIIEVKIQEIGVYVRDGFEFSGNQFLGYWNPKTNYVGKNVFGKYIGNKNYREYRERHGKGMDFYNFSDIIWTDVDYTFNANIIEF